ncbi:heme o synthase [Luteococcus sp. OSA5]|uniref:heme o synthase n=1 Tax=Luteococcus sp. OSA5 TaxID=3401630 RepID=UPI003B43B066
MTTQHTTNKTGAPQQGAPGATVDDGAQAQAQGRASFTDVVKAYVALTKPRIIELLLTTTLPVMFLAAGGVPPLWVALWTMVGGMLSAGSANAFNCILDADIDEVMRRTRRRPMPRHRVSTRNAYLFAIVLAVVSTLVLGLGANWLSAGLALGANAFYVFVYTMWLKRRTSQNIVWGGIAGCFPPLIGWTAITGSVSWAPILLFLVVFFWTPPHTWALAFRYREDYAAANVPMLPVVMDAVGVCRRILFYSVLTVLTTLLVWPVAETGWIYPAVAIIAGAVFLWEAWLLLKRAKAGKRDTELKAMRLFHWSNSYLAILFLAIAIDPLVF